MTDKDIIERRLYRRLYLSQLAGDLFCPAYLCDGIAPLLERGHAIEITTKGYRLTPEGEAHWLNKPNTRNPLTHSQRSILLALQDGTPKAFSAHRRTPLATLSSHNLIERQGDLWRITSKGQSVLADTTTRVIRRHGPQPDPRPTFTVAATATNAPAAAPDPTTVTLAVAEFVAVVNAPADRPHDPSLAQLEILKGLIA